MRIDGKEIAEKIFEELKVRVDELKKKNITPHLAVILVGENPASVAYITLKQRKGVEIGARFTLIKYNTDVTTDGLLGKVKELNNDPSVHGILIQRPLPPQIDVEKLEMLTDPKKDIDGFHPDSPYTLPLPLAVVKILEEIHNGKDHSEFLSWLKSRNIIVLGKGPTGGGPILKYLTRLGITATIIDRKTENPDQLMKNADIIICAVGREKFVKPESIKKGVILVGVGVLKGEDGKLHGDYEPDEIKAIAGSYTPTPGGVGPVNVAELWNNLLTAAEKQT